MMSAGLSVSKAGVPEERKLSRAGVSVRKLPFDQTRGEGPILNWGGAIGEGFGLEERTINRSGDPGVKGQGLGLSKVQGSGHGNGRLAIRDSVRIQLGVATLDARTTDWCKTQDGVQQALTGLQGFITQGRDEISKNLDTQENTAVTERVASAITVGSVFLADKIEVGGHALTQTISKKGAGWRAKSRLQKELKIHPSVLNGVAKAAFWSSKVEDVAEGFKGHVQGLKKAVAANVGRVARETGHTERLPREIVGLGSMTVASFDAFARVRDAAEDAAREVLTEGSTVASDVIALRYGTQAGALAKECFEGVGNMVDAAIAVDNVIWKLQPEVFAISFTKKTMRHVVGSHLARICAEEYDRFAVGTS